MTYRNETDILLALLLIETIILLSIISSSLRNKFRLRTATKRVQITEYELNTLKTSLNFDFLLNAINNLYGHSIAAPANVSLKIARLAELLRFRISVYNNHQSLLKDEIIFFKHYLEYMVDSHHGLACRMSVEGEPKNQYVPHNTFIVFFENAIRHAMHGRDPNVVIHWAIENKSVRFTLTNSAIYTSTPAAETNGSINSLEQRLKNLGYQYTIEKSKGENYYMIVFELHF